MYLTPDYKDIITLFNKHNVIYIGPLPLPVKHKNDNIVHSRIIKIRKHLLKDVMLHMQTLDLPPSVQVEFKNI